jgi:hypothetical protein
MDRLPDITQPYVPDEAEEEEEILVPEEEPEPEDEIFVRPKTQKKLPEKEEESKEEENINDEMTENSDNEASQNNLEENETPPVKTKYPDPRYRRWTCECGQVLEKTGKYHEERHRNSKIHRENLRRKQRKEEAKNEDTGKLIRQNKQSKPNIGRQNAVFSEEDTRKKYYEQFIKEQEEAKLREQEELERKKKEEEEMEKKYFEKFKRLQLEEQNKVKQTNQLLTKPDDFGEYSSYF